MKHGKKERKTTMEKRHRRNIKRKKGKGKEA